MLGDTLGDPLNLAWLIRRKNSEYEMIHGRFLLFCMGPGPDKSGFSELSDKYRQRLRMRFGHQGIIGLFKGQIVCRF